jgi:hypothetical protein
MAIMALPKEFERSAVRTAAAEVLPRIADKAVGLTPDVINGWFTSFPNFTAVALPLASTALGTLLSGLIAHSVSNTQLAENLSDYVDDIRADFFALYSQRLRESHASLFKNQPGALDSVLPPPMGIIDPDNRGVIHNRNCEAVERTIRVPGRKGQKGQPDEPDKQVPRKDLRMVRIEHAQRMNLMYAPCCAELFAVDIEELATRAAKIAAAMPKTAAETKPTSFLGFLARAKAGSIKGLTAEDIKRLAGYCRQLSAEEIDELAHIDSEEELAGLVLAEDIDQFRKMVSTAKDRVVHKGIANALGIPLVAAHNAAESVRHAWEGMGAWAIDAEKRADARTATLRKKRATLPPRPAAPPMTEGPGMRLWHRLFRDS